jgi:hypothetical protein
MRALCMCRTLCFAPDQVFTQPPSWGSAVLSWAAIESIPRSTGAFFTEPRDWQAAGEQP